MMRIFKVDTLSFLEFSTFMRGISLRGIMYPTNTEYRVYEIL